uniref:(northern house mosquito) hypothetical protein n=1 Tax=Culex pipiens TaxID=7175 RepID=A0A8D8A663_CULPI
MCCRRGAGAGGASMNTNSTVNVPLMFSVSYGLGCSSRTWVEAGPFDSSSIPTRPSPKNFWKPPTATESYTSNRSSVELLDRSKRKVSSQNGFGPILHADWCF